MRPLEAIVLIPGVIAGSVGFVELRASVRTAEKVKRLAPVVLAFALVGVFLLLDIAIYVTWRYMSELTYAMTSLSVLVGLSGAVVRYSCRRSAILMGTAGLLLAYYWGVLSVPRP